MTEVALFVTCVVDLAAPDTGFAAARVLASCGDRVRVPEGVTCCGQPAWNSGQVGPAAKVARATLEALDDGTEDPIVVPAGSCATMLRLYWPQLFELAGDPTAAARARTVGARVRELTEHVAARLPDPPVGDARPVAVHASCHLLRELHVDDEPLACVAAAGCEAVEWPDAERCCGFGGAFSVKLPEVSVGMADEKLGSLPEGVTEVLGTDLSCLLHLQGRADHEGRAVRFRHVATALAERLAGEDRP